MSRYKSILPVWIFTKHKVCYLFLLIIPLLSLSQSHNHWTRGFNEESSLLSGAVVGGGAGPSAIYYNPASISEITFSKFSLNASLFSFDFINIKNAFGNGIDVESTKGLISPRFISYMVQPKKHPEWSFEIAILNNETYDVEIYKSVEQRIDVLTHLPGIEKYYALFQYSNKYRDDWIGFGGSWKLNSRFFVGTSMFVSIKSLDYKYLIDIEAFPTDSVYIDNEYVPFYSANYQEMEDVKYNDYRLLWKFGLLYKWENLSIGMNITTPSVGGIYSDGKRITHKEKQSNISLPETGEPLPNYVIVGYQEKKDVSVNSKSPFSIAAGLTYYIADKSKILYTTVEYFGGLDPYRLVQADESSDLLSGSILENVNPNEWMTFVGGAKPVLNAAIGYRWNIEENVMLMAGFRTDFNYRKNIDYEPFIDEKKIHGLDLDIYHITAGITVRILGQDFITGLQYSLSREKNQKPYTNLAEPIEFNTAEKAALQGTRGSNMDISYNSISIYFGATFNFGNDKK